LVAKPKEEDILVDLAAVQRLDLAEGVVQGALLDIRVRIGIAARLGVLQRGGQQLGQVKLWMDGTLVSM
jgi:hypothetical protein